MRLNDIDTARARYNFIAYAATAMWTVAQITLIAAYSIVEIALIALKTAPSCDALHFILLATAGIGLLVVLIQCAMVTYNYQELAELTRGVYVPIWIYFLPCLVQCYMYFAAGKTCLDQYARDEIALFHGNLIIFLILVAVRVLGAVENYVRACFMRAATCPPPC